MKVTIPKSLLDGVVCHRDFCCVESDGSALCEVDHLEGLDIYLCLKYLNPPCPSCSDVLINEVNFRTCTCRVRHEIFKQTGK